MEDVLKVTGKKMKEKEKDLKFFPKEITLKVIFRKINQMDKEITIGKPGSSIVVNGYKDYVMDTVFGKETMDFIMKVNGKMGKCMEKVCI